MEIQTSYSAVLFDLDGTLVHSAPFWEQACMAVIDEEDLDISRDRLLQYNQRAHPFHKYVVEHGFEGDVEELRARRDEQYMDLLRKNIGWMPGADNVLRGLQESGKPLGIITTSYKRYVDVIHEALGVRDYMNAVITNEDIEHGKPNPEGVLLCAERLSIDPQECVYVGDHIVDMQAARAAGMTGVLIPGGWTPESARAEADYVFESITELCP